MNRGRLFPAILLVGLLLAMSACGNKGPLFLPEEEAEKKLDTQEQ